MRNSMEWGQVARLFAKAMQSPMAVRHGPTTMEWDISGNCEAPNVRELHAAPEGARRTGKYRGRVFHNDGDPLGTGLPFSVETVSYGPKVPTKRGPVFVGKGTRHPLTVILHSRCRSCRKCLRRRQQAWALKAKAECLFSVRTWFGTMTLNPDAQHKYLSMARHDLVRSGLDFDKLDEAEQFRLRHAEISKELTKWAKRVRKESGAALRYLIVAERHKSGLPHYHVLVHETTPLQPVRERTLRKQWRIGYSKFNLVTDEAQATYVCKYLSKDAAARVRASLHYGNGTLSRDREAKPNVKNMTSPNKPTADAGTELSEGVNNGR